jgi:peptidyl-prolyl cis-trans isomerase D
LVVQAALDNEAERIGISVGDTNVATTLRSISAFQGAGGVFDRATYEFQLANIGQTTIQFEDSIRRDTARSILQTATAAGIETPQNLRDELINFYATQHSFDLFTLTEADLPTPVAAPDTAAVQAYYEANIDRFTTPESRAITYAWLTPEMLVDAAAVSEEDIRRLYNERIDQYVQPERRLVERLVFPDDAAASAAMARIDNGSASFDDLVAERGLTLDDADMGDVTEADLGEAGPAVFALTEPGAVTGPLPTFLGPALFRMNAILNAQETTLDEVRDELRGELSAERTRRMIADMRETIIDILAGGATIEQLAAETDMQLGTIAWTQGSDEGIAAYAEFGTAAAAATANDFPELMELSDGGVFALRLDGITPAAPRPLDEVRQDAAAGARVQAAETALMERARALSVELVAQGAQNFSDAQGLVPESFQSVTRLDSVAQVPAPMLESILSADAGTTVINIADGQVLMALVGEDQAPDPADEQTGQLIRAVDEQIGAALAQDVYEYFARALEAEAGISLNQAAINAVHANFQ